MPYITPGSVPTGRICRPVFIPDSSDWLAIVSGALTELTKLHNWEQTDGITPQAAVDAAWEMVYAYWDEACGGDPCVQPGGEPILRQTVGGETEQLIEGAWAEPTGDYAIPNTPARTEATAEERRCLAAKNAVHALELLYEELTDQYGAGATEAELLIDLSLFIGALIVPVFGLIAVGLYGMFTVGWKLVFELFEELTADYWTPEITEKLVCIFYDNSTDVSGVVSFNMDGVRRGITDSLINTFEGDLYAQKLALQLNHIFDYVPAEAWAHAGTATVITDADCGCGDAWCYAFEGFDLYNFWKPTDPTKTVWDNTAEAWRAALTVGDCDPFCGGVQLQFKFFIPYSSAITNVQFLFTRELGGVWTECIDDGAGFVDCTPDATPGQMTLAEPGAYSVSASERTYTLTHTKNDYTDIPTIYRVILYGTGVRMFGTEDNC